MGSILYALEVPPYGGDTLFANQYLAYESLSDGMKTMLAGLKVVHSDIRVAGPQAGLNARRSSKVREDANWRPTENVHPAVRTHPETGRKCLFVNHSYSCRLRGHDGSGEPAAAGLPDESRPSARVHLPVSLASRLDRVLGQSLHQASGGPRCGSVPQEDATHADCRRAGRLGLSDPAGA